MRWLALVALAGCLVPQAPHALDACAASTDDAATLHPTWQGTYEEVAQAAGEAFGVRVEPHPEASLMSPEEFDLRWTEHGILYLMGESGQVHGFTFDSAHPRWNASQMHDAIASLGLPALEVEVGPHGAVASQVFAGRPIRTGGGLGTTVHATWIVDGTPVDNATVLAAARAYAACSGWSIEDESLLGSWGIHEGRLVAQVLLQVPNACPLYHVVYVEAFSGLPRGSMFLSGCM